MVSVKRCPEKAGYRNEQGHIEAGSPGCARVTSSSLVTAATSEGQ